MITCAITEIGVIGMASSISRLYKQSANFENGTEYLRKAKTELFNLCQRIKESTNNDDVQRHKFINLLIGRLQKTGAASIDPNITFQYLNNVIMSDNSNMENFVNQSRTSQIFDNPEEFQNIKQAPFKFLEDAYGSSSAKSPALHEQENNLIDVILFERQGLNLPFKRVTNMEELNQNIRSYQEILFRKIVDYFKYLRDNVLDGVSKKRIEEDLNEVFENPKLYEVTTDSYVDSGNLSTLMPYIKTYLNLSPNTLTDLYNHTAYKNENSPEKLRLDAYNAYVFLQNYDHFLLSIFGKSIQINDFGKLTGNDKYILNSNTGRNTTNWNTDNRDVAEQADMLTKLVLNHTPYYKRGTDSLITGKFVSFQKFQHITGKIKTLYFNSTFASIDFSKEVRILDSYELSKEAKEYFIKHKTFRRALAQVKYNYKNNIKYIYELILNKNFYSEHSELLNNLFTEDEINILYSVYKEIYSDDENSIFSLSKTPGLFDMASYISATAVDIYNNELIQFYRTADNDIEARTLMDQSIANIKRQFETSLQLWNMRDRFTNYDEYVQNLFVNVEEVEEKDKNGNVNKITFKLIFKSGDSNDIYLIKFDPSDLNINTYLPVQDKLRLIYEILQPLNLKNNADLRNAFKQKYKSNEEAMNRLFDLAINIFVNSYISAKYIENQTSKTEINNVVNTYFKGSSKPRFNNTTLEFIHGINTQTLQKLAEAQADLSGLTTATLVKSGDRKNQNRQTLSRLFGSFFEQFELQDKEQDSAVNELTLINNTNYFKGIFQAKEYYDYFGNIKDVTNMNAAEMFFPLFITNYMIQYSDNNRYLGKGKAAFLISVNSDKPNISCMITDLRARIFNNKSINQLTSDELNSLIAQDFGKVYRNIINNVCNDWVKFFNFLSREDHTIVTEIWKNSDELKNDFFNDFARFNEFCKENNVVPKEVMSTLRRIFEENSNEQIDFIDQIHYFADKKGNIHSNKTLISQLFRFDPDYFSKMDKSVTSGMVTQSEFWKLKEHELLQGLLRYDVEINTIDAIQEGIKQLKSKSNPIINDIRKRWIDDAGDIIWAKFTLKNGEVVNITNQEEYDNLVNRINKETKQNIDATTIFTSGIFGTLQIHPELSKFNKISYYNSQSFMLATVGTFAAHPAKGTFSSIIEEEAARFNAQHKRNVSMTAAMHSFLLNAINGVPSTYNIAILEDLKDFASTVHGETSSITAFDGSTFVNPFMVILENNSLEGNSAGITKKQFIHYYNQKYGTGGIIKTAGFGLTNDWIRNSPYLKKMMMKMTDIGWNEMKFSEKDSRPINIMDRAFYYRGIDPKSLYKPIFFKEHGKYYTIDINSVQMDDPYHYKYDVYEVYENGEIVNNSLDHREANITSNYKLWKFFGGEYSMELKNGKLKYSNISVEQTVTAINEIGVANNGVDTTQVLTQEEVFQPLKHSMIHYIPTLGAIKYGGANINTVKDFEDEDIELSTTKVKILQAGIQLDKEHHADDAEISLMTQVISACASLGYTFDAAAKVYKALAAANMNNTKNFYNGLITLFNSNGEDSSKIKELINKILIEELVNSKNDSIAKNMAISLQKKIQNGELKLSNDMFPLSDNTIYAKLLSTINSFLTNSGIKSKIPGILSVLTPSYKINRIYNGKKFEEYDNPEQELAELQNQAKQNPIYSEGSINFRLKSVDETDEDYYAYRKQEILKHGNPFAGLRFGTIYNIRFKNGEEIELELNTIEKYQKLKEDVFKGNIVSFYENIQAGRELAPYNSRFEIQVEDENPISAQLWDIDSINDLNKLKHAIKSNDVDTIYEIAKYYISENTINILDQNQLVRLLGKKINTKLQQDLLNLSTNVNQIYEQAKEAIEIFRNSDPNIQTLENKLCILLHLNPANHPITTRNQEGQYEFDRSKFDNILEQVRNTTKVSIGRKLYKVNKESIKIEPYEVIMSKTFQSAFGLDENTQLSEILNDPLYFLKQYQKNIQIKVDDSNYDIAFKRFDGKHIYILNKDRADFTDATPITPMTMRDSEGVIWRLDSKYNKMYQINPGDVIYERDGQEVIVTEKPQFYINNLNYDLIQFSKKLIQKDQDSTQVLKYYLQLLKDSDNNSANMIFNELSFDLHETGVFKYEDQFYANNDRINTVNLNDQSSFLYQRSIEKHNSFKTALNIVAARVPAQSMQSFMAMKIVAFENSDVNTVYVNTMQLLLQGSDFDIDTVNLVTYDVNNNGLLDLHSPFAKIDSEQHIEESFKLPFPNGQRIPLNEFSNSSENIYNILSKYRGLFITRFEHDKKGMYDYNKPIISIDPERLEQLGSFLNEASELRLLDENDLTISLDGQNYDIIFGVEEKGLDLKYVDNLNILLKALINQVINKHNMYFDRLSHSKIERIVNNQSVHNMIQIIKTPINQQQGHVSVDGTTDPLKAIGEQSSNARLVKERTAGNVLNQIESITDNQIGKTCIGICAVALKSFFATTQYCNTVLNSGDSNAQNKLISNNVFVGKDGKQRMYKTIANIRAKNINSITNEDLIQALAYAQYNEEDAAVLLSALLSLSTDNAKELTLAKLNAVSQMISLYLYGISIGIPFSDLANTIMSPAGNIVIKAMQGNMFSGKEEMIRISNATFNFIENCEDKNLAIYNKSYLSTGERIAPAYKGLLEYLKSRFSDVDEIKNSNSLGNVLYLIYTGQNISIEDIMDNYINKYVDSVKGSSRSQAIALRKKIQHVLKNLDILLSDPIQSTNYENIKMLTEGASEIYVLGRLLGLNQGIKTEGTKYISQLNVLRYAIYNKKDYNDRSEDDIIDIERYCVDAEYRAKCIEEYENVKTSINILDVLDKSPHFSSYLINLAESLAIHKQGYKFRSVYDNVLFLSKEYNMPQDQVTKGLTEYIGDKMLNDFLQRNNITVVVDGGVKFFTSEESEDTTQGQTPFRLGNTLNNQTFRKWVEINLIPELKSRPELKDNKFIQDLIYDLNNKTVSHNTENVLALPTTMLPRTDAERTLFNEYKQEFNKLSVFTKNGMALTDIFILYGMIANRWKLSERSFVPLFDDFKDSGLIKAFYNYESQQDASGETLDLTNMQAYMEDIIGAYLAKPESPWYSRAKYIWMKDSETKKYKLAKYTKLDNTSYDDLYSDFADIDLVDTDFSDIDELNIGKTLPNEWQFVSEIPNPKKFPSGNLFLESKVYKFINKDSGKGIGIELFNDGTIKRLNEFELINGQWQKVSISSKLRDALNNNELIQFDPLAQKNVPNEKTIKDIIKEDSCQL